MDVWNKALTDTEVIDQLWNGGTVFASNNIGDYPESGNLVAGFHLDGDASNFVNSDYGGTIWGDTNSISWTPDAPGVRTATYTTVANQDLTTPGQHEIPAVFTSTDGAYATSTSAVLPLLVLPATPPAAIISAPPNQAEPSPLTDGSLVLPFAPAALTYVSNSVGNAAVGVDTAIPDMNDPSDTSVPLSYVAATLTLDGMWSNTVDYSATGVEAGTSYRFTVPIEGCGLSTGCYNYAMTFTEYFANGHSINLPTQSNFSGITNVLNWTNSPFGAGWNLNGLDQLTFDGTGNATYVRSDGTMGYFTYNGNNTPFTSPAGPFAFLQLTTDGNGDYWLNDPSTGTTEAFNASGRWLPLPITTAT